MMNIEIDGSRAAAQGALGYSESQAVHHANERDNARGLPGLADLFTYRAHIPPICPNAAAIRRQPNILIPNINDRIERIINSIQETRNWQTAICSAIGQNRRRRHEPKLAHIIIKALRMGCIIPISLRNAAKHILKTLIREKIAVQQCPLTKIRQ